jgi:hypothetical protein
MMNHRAQQASAVDELRDVDVKKAAHRFVLPETMILMLISSVDLASTIYLVATNQAIEANPLMAGVLYRFGPTAFVLAKTMLVAIPLTIAELLRDKRPAFIRTALRVAILAYVGVYIVAFMRWNHWIFTQ